MCSNPSATPNPTPTPNPNPNPKPSPNPSPNLSPTPEQVYLVDVIFELLMFGEIGLKMLISGVYSDRNKVRPKG